ncbi:DUF5723 family protein [Candidatus Kapabacteria bacterium]|nr:DUF5723 family protein [Candidatus Kapabacteria bacterium]
MKNLLIIAILLFASELFAGFGSFGLTSSRYVSQSGVGVANPDRIYSVGLNPAGTMMIGDSSYLQFNVAFPNVSLGFNNSSFEGGDIEKYFNAENGSSKILSVQDEDDFLNLIDGNAESFIQLRLNLFRAGIMISPKIGAFTVSIDDNVAVKSTLPKELMELAFRGNTIGREYNFSNFEYQASVLRSYSLNYARPIISDSKGFIKNLNIGVGVKFVQSFGYADFNTDYASLFTDSSAKLGLNFSGQGRSAAGDELFNEFNDNEGDGFSSPFPSAGGSGIGFDIGGIAQLRNGLQLGLSITDIGTIKFDQNVDISNHSLVTLVEDLTEKEIDSIADGTNKITAMANEFDIDLPTALRFGITVPVQKFIPMLGILNASVDVSQGFNDNFANSTNTRFAIGAEWLPFQSLPSLMAGVGNDRFNNTRFSLGLGYSIKIFDVYIGSRDFLATISGGKRASVSLNIRWKIW